MPNSWHISVGTPQITNSKNRVFPYKPSFIFVPLFLETPLSQFLKFQAYQKILQFTDWCEYVKVDEVLYIYWLHLQQFNSKFAPLEDDPASFRGTPSKFTSIDFLQAKKSHFTFWNSGIFMIWYDVHFLVLFPDSTLRKLWFNGVNV